MQIILAGFQHENGGCIFASTTEIVQDYQPSTTVVFANPEHPNGGCIFADYRDTFPATRRTSGHRIRRIREDEEILAIIIAATFTLN